MPTDERRADARRNREAVLDAAERLLAERPDASMAAIADASGVGRTTVYRHFPTREDLLATLFERVVGESIAVVTSITEGDGEAEEVLRRLGHGIAAIASRFRFLAAHRHLGEEAIGRATASGDEPLERWLTDAAARGVLRGDLTPAWLAAFARGLASAAAEEIADGRADAAQAGDALGEAYVRLCLPTTP